MLKHVLQTLGWGPAAPAAPNQPPVAADRSPAAPPDDPLPPTKGDTTEPPVHKQPHRLIELSVAGLQAQRQALDRQQRQTFESLQGLHGDCRGVVARYAAARVHGRPNELQALERVYDNIQTRVQTAELRHADQVHRLKLVDHVCVLREDLASRQELEQGALAGMDLNDLKVMLDRELALLLSSRSKVHDLLSDIETFDEDARQQASGAMRSTHEELMALTESEVKRAVTMRLSMLDDVAAQFEQSQAGSDRAVSDIAARATRAQGEVLR